MKPTMVDINNYNLEREREREISRSRDIIITIVGSLFVKVLKDSFKSRIMPFFGTVKWYCIIKHLKTIKHNYSLYYKTNFHDMCCGISLNKIDTNVSCFIRWWRKREICEGVKCMSCLQKQKKINQMTYDNLSQLIYMNNNTCICQLIYTHFMKILN